MGDKGTDGVDAGLLLSLDTGNYDGVFQEALPDLSSFFFLKP